ncbi:MAG: single-stranded DNA-binding protein [Rhodanobacteraceae bacterium]|nr:single-stranded DNA-binding protein [Rhodanobacteraceae bacterium]
MATKNTKSNSNRPSNYVILTLMAIADGEMKYSAVGKPFSFVRAFLSQGKDKQTEGYKPSIFFDVKAFCKDEDVSALVQNVADIQNKDRFTVKGRLGMDEWTGEDGVKRQKLAIFAKSIEPFVFEKEDEAESEDELEGEPA